MKKVKLKGDNIQTILARKNMSQNWLAKKLEISSAYMSQLLTGKRTLSPRMRDRIQKQFVDSEYDELFEIIG